MAAYKEDSSSCATTPRRTASGTSATTTTTATTTTATTTPTTTSTTTMAATNHNKEQLANSKPHHCQGQLMGLQEPAPSREQSEPEIGKMNRIKQGGGGGRKGENQKLAA